MKSYQMGLMVAGSLMMAATSASALVWSGNGNDYELVFSSEITWASAKDQAVIKGGYLATLTSAEENTWVYDNLIASYYPAGEGQNEIVIGRTDQFWLGGSVTKVGNGFGVAWVTGENSAFTNFAPEEPNNASGVEMGGITINRFGNGTWNDEGAWMAAVKGFIVEKNPTSVPDGGSTLILAGLALAGMAALRRKL